MLVYCRAQQNHTVSFSYDSDGNRISREILIQRIDKNQGETEMKPSTATDFFKTTTIELFPNPAGDQFMVEIDPRFYFYYGTSTGNTLWEIIMNRIKISTVKNNEKH